MRAVVLIKDTASFEIENVNPAPARPREAIAELRAADICRTDQSLQSSKMSMVLAGPSILGHEVIGNGAVNVAV